MGLGSQNLIIFMFLGTYRCAPIKMIEQLLGNEGGYIVVLGGDEDEDDMQCMSARDKAGALWALLELHSIEGRNARGTGCRPWRRKDVLQDAGTSHTNALLG